MTEPLIIGRQPETMHITPSKPNAWYGTIIEGKRFTAEQLNVLKRMGMDAAKVDAIVVKRNATHREYWWPRGSYPPQFHFDCPVMGRKRDGSVIILAPAGFAQTVRSDGWVGEPGKIKRSL